MKPDKKHITLVVGFFTIAIACLVLTGWFFDLPLLKSVLPGLVSMKFNTAVCFLLLGISLLLINNNKARSISVILCAAVIIISILTILEYIFNLHLGIDELFWKEGTSPDNKLFPGRFGAATGLNFILASFTLLAMRSRKARGFIWIALMLIFLVSALAFLSYIFSIPYLNSSASFTKLALHTSVAFIVLCFGIYYSQEVSSVQISFQWKLFSGFILVLLVLAVVIYIYNKNDQHYIGTSQWVEHTNEVLHRSDQAIASLSAIESDVRGYILTGEEVFLNDYYSEKDKVFGLFSQLKTLTEDNKEQQEKVVSLTGFAANRFLLFDKLVALRKSREYTQQKATGLIIDGQNSMRVLKSLIGDMQGVEKKLLETRKIDNQQSIGNAKSILYFFVFVMLGVLFLLLIIIFDNMRARQAAENRVLTLNAGLEQGIEERTVSLAESEKKYRSLFQNSPLPMWVLDKDTFGFLDVNGSALEQYGYTRDEFLSMNAVDLRTEEEKERFRKLNRPFVKGTRNTGVWQHQRKNGSLLYAEVSSHEIVYEGKEARLVLSIDVTNRKKAEEEIARSETRFRNTLDKMLEGIQIIGFDWKYLYVNHSMAKHGKYAKEEYIGYTVMEKYPGIEDTEIFNVYKQCFDERVAAHLENEFVFPDGSKGWFELSFQPVPEGIFILSVDITERKKAEEDILKLNDEISKREQRFRAIIESSNDIVSLMDENYKFFYRSPSAERISGWSPGESEFFEQAIERSHPHDIAKMRKALRESLEQPGIGIPFMYRKLHKKGHYIWLEGVITNMLADEELRAFVINLQDVSARKESEEKLARSESTYRTIASNIPGTVICLLDTDCRYLLIEGDLLEKLGYSKEKLLGNRIKDVLTPERSAKVLPYFERVFKGESIVMEDQREGYDTISRYVPLKDDAGNVYAAMTVVFDVSELKHIQRELADLNHNLEDKITERTAQLAAANKELESFSYSVSHDLRAPLRGIDGWSLALLEDYGNSLDERAHQYLDRVRSETQRMGELIDDLLKLSRVSKTEVRPGKVHLSAIAKVIEKRLHEENPNRQIHISVQPGLKAMGDENLIEIMLTNLLNNACKFTGKKEVAEITFGSKNIEGTETYFISDNGAGFNMNNAKNLFGAFQRMHRQSDFPGTGIGLATVQRIINLHHGKIWVEAAIDQGATFYFQIPK